MATSSFFYGQTPGPDQSTIDELIADLAAKVAAAQESQNNAALSAAVAQAAADSAQASEASTSGLLIQAQAALEAAQAAQAAAEDALELAQDAIDSVASDAAAADASRIAAQAAQALAETAEANAETAQTNAQASATAAASSATSASGSATSAASSASNAASSATTATTQASNAATSATTASTAATNASNSATAAAGSATTATTKAGEAATSASAAAGSATAASTSATNASNSASAASTSASNAASSATAAASSATSAAGSATTATSAASSATSSASAASTSATNASNSASAASTSATNAANSATAASTSATNASTSATNAANSATAASGSATAAASSATSAAASYDAFDDRYLGSKTSDPTLDNDGNALLTGALYFNSASNIMKVYNGSTWQNAGSSVNGTSRRFRYIATSGQTTFSGTDTNAGVLSYDVGFIDVYLNGARLDQTDFTATNGTSIVLAAAAALNDELNIVAYGTFQSANHVAKTGDTMSGGLNVLGNLGVGTSSPAVSGDFQKSGDVQIRARETGLGVDTRMLAVGGTSQAGILGTYSNHPLVINANGVEAFRVPPNAGGIQFLATQRASSDPNTLDDYEEGTWTPTINLLGTVTYTARFGKYQKIGKYVRVTFALYMSSTDTTQDSTAMLISSLPFTVTNALGSDYENGSACLLTERMRATAAPSAANTFHVIGTNGTTSLVVVQNNYNSIIGNASYFGSNGRSGYFGGTMYVLGQFTYETNA